jgi:hypothetical protein
MTEQAWLACSDPAVMLRFLHGKVSDRKRRLFAAACCRRLWHLLTDERSRWAVEVAERYADAQATEKELAIAADAAWSAWDADRERYSTAGDEATEFDDHLPDLASQAAYNVALPLGWWGGAPAFVEPDKTARAVSADKRAEGAAQCVLLREIHGNPFRADRLDAAVRVWNGATVPKLAQAIYDNHCFGDMPILADALEEAGCTNAEILDHCRQSAEHARGCWVLDLVLGKE